MSLLIRKGRIVLADKDFTADIFVDRGKIQVIGEALAQPADLIIDASGNYVIPGGIDVHTHLEAPVGGTLSSDDFESGTRAAAFGGTTCIIDFATQEKGQMLGTRHHGGRACRTHGFAAFRWPRTAGRRT